MRLLIKYGRHSAFLDRCLSILVDRLHAQYAKSRSYIYQRQLLLPQRMGTMSYAEERAERERGGEVKKASPTEI